MRGSTFINLVLVLAFGALLLSGSFIVSGISKQSSATNNCGIELCFTPFQDCTSFIVGKIVKANNELDVAAYVLSNKEIADAITNVIDRGIDVKIIFDAHQAKQSYSLDELLSKKGAKIKYLGIGSSKKMHNKFIVIDKNFVITGSFNFSNSANRNYENVVFLNCCKAAEKFKHYFYSLWQHGRQAN